MVVVERLGPLLDDSAESAADLGNLFLVINMNQQICQLDIAFPETTSTGDHSARVTVGGRLVFACARGSCRSTTLELQGIRVLLNTTSLSSPAAALALRWRTRQQVVLAESAAVAATACFPAAAAQAQAWAAAGRLRPGAAVFKNRGRKSFSRLYICTRLQFGHLFSAVPTENDRSSFDHAFCGCRRFLPDLKGLRVWRVPEVYPNIL